MGFEPDPKNFETPTFAADAVIFRLGNDKREVALIQISNEERKEPYCGLLAFPGGKHDDGETMEGTCRRELKEETNLDPAEMALLGIYGADPNAKYRDLRRWTISHVFLVETTSEDGVAGDDAVSFGWYDVDKIDRKRMAYDHYDILVDAMYGRRAVGEE